MKAKKTSVISPCFVDLYVRVSTLEQAREGYSIAEQESRLRQYCNAMGFQIYHVHVDAGYSGASLDRPGVQSMIHDVRNHSVSKVIVWKLDRLSRSQRDMLVILEDVFLENGCDFVSMMESFDTSTAFGRMFVGILAAFAQLERENIKERTAMGRQARLVQGHYNSSRPPLGYKFISGTNDLIVDPFEATIVQEIFKSFLSGISINGIAEHLKNRYPTVRAWTGTMVRRTLQNPAYIGKVRDVDVIRDGIHHPIIPEANFHTTNVILEHNREIRKQSCRSHALLTGLLYCGDCGARMQPRRITRGYDLRRYVCYSVSRTSKAMIRSEYCTNRLHPYTLDELDHLIISEIQKLATDQKYLEPIILEDTKPELDENQLLQDRLAEVTKQVDKLLSLYQIGAVELCQIEERLSALKVERASLLERIEHSPVSMNIDITQIQSHAMAFQEAIEAEDIDTMRRIIRLLIDKIVVLNTDIEIHWTFC